MFYYEKDNELYKFIDLYNLIYDATYDKGNGCFSEDVKDFCLDVYCDEYLDNDVNLTKEDFYNTIADATAEDEDNRIIDFICDALIPYLNEKFNNSDYIYCDFIDNVIYRDNKV